MALGLIIRVSGSFEYSGIVKCRKNIALLTNYGGVGDGKTSNTKAFQSAIAHLSQLRGGGVLIVQPGKWVTGSFNLTSHFTLYLQEGATILGSQDASEWPLIAPLPSYGRGRDAAGGRYQSLIWGTNLTDVVITGCNGTIDGQGSWWWEKFRKKQLQNTRPYLVELLYSDQILISNLTLQNSPSWHIHPTYCSNVIIQHIAISATVDSPNTDGINPDSCSDTKIQDCHIVSGDDCIAVKSGWDEYGIAFGMPSENIIIRRVTCISPYSALVALGSEMSGGIKNVWMEDLRAVHTESALRIKTAPGRGSFVKHIYVKGMELRTVKYGIWMTGAYGDHPDNYYDPKAIPVVNSINFANIKAYNVTMPGKLEGIAGYPFTGICLSNVGMQLAKQSKEPWNCTNVAGYANKVDPEPCSLLKTDGAPTSCPYPVEKPAIDSVLLKTCKCYFPGN